MIYDALICDNFNFSLICRTVDSDGFYHWNPTVRTRCQTLEFEFWETGYKYTSSAILTKKAQVGDILIVLTDESYEIQMNVEHEFVYDKSFIYLVTDFDDESNTATLQNYFWASIEGMEFPKSNLSSSGSFGNVIANCTLSTMTNGQLPIMSYISSEAFWEMPASFNVKDDTFDATSLMQKACRKVRASPLVVLQRPHWNFEDLVDDTEILCTFNSRDFVTDERPLRELRIDESFDVQIDTEIDTARSDYNFVNVYLDTSAEDADQPVYTFQYSMTADATTYAPVKNPNDSTATFTPPYQRKVKTMFYDRDKMPSDAEAFSEITADSVYRVYQFDIKKIDIEINDLFKIYHGDDTVTGYIADIQHTAQGSRAMFIQEDNYFDLPTASTTFSS